MESSAHLPLHCETVRSNQFELLTDLAQRRYDAWPPPREIPRERLRASLGEMMRDTTIARIWIAYEGRKPAGYAIMTLGCSLASGGRHAVLDECFLLPEFATPEGYGAVLSTVEAAAEGLRLGRVFIFDGRGDSRFAEAIGARGYAPAHGWLFVRDQAGAASGR